MLFALALISALACGAIGGLLFAFSVAVMKALSRLPPAEGMAAMQSINREILNPLFLSVFLGSAVASGLAVILSIARWTTPGSGWMLAGGLLYLIGTFLVTIAINVPKNNALDRLSPDDPRAVADWKDYLSGWTAWNHFRTAASLAASASFAVAIRSMPASV